MHRLDAARAFRLALETGVAGSRYHAVGEEGTSIRELAEVIGRRLNLPVAAKAPEDAAEHFGFLSMFIGLDAPASSALTLEGLGRMPTHRGLVADLEKGGYFEKTKSKFSSG